LRRNNTERANSFHFTASRQQIRSQGLARVGRNSMADIAVAIAAKADLSHVYFQAQSGRANL
jgi:hypothetical protein